MWAGPQHEREIHQGNWDFDFLKKHWSWSRELQAVISRILKTLSGPHRRVVSMWSFPVHCWNHPFCLVLSREGQRKCPVVNFHWETFCFEILTSQLNLQIANLLRETALESFPCRAQGGNQISCGGKHKPSTEVCTPWGHREACLGPLSISLRQKHSCQQRSLWNLEQTNFSPCGKRNLTYNAFYQRNT